MKSKNGKSIAVGAIVAFKRRRIPPHAYKLFQEREDGYNHTLAGVVDKIDEPGGRVRIVEGSVAFPRRHWHKASNITHTGKRSTLFKAS